MFKWLKKSLANPIWSAVQIVGFGNTIHNQQDQRNLLREGYMRNPFVHAIIKLTARQVASLPTYIKIGDEPYEGKTPHKLDLLLERPNPYQAKEQLISDLVAYYMNTGDGFMQILNKDFETVTPNHGAMTGTGYIPDNDSMRLSEPMELWVWPSDKINPIQGPPNNPILGYEFSDSRTIRMDSRQWIHVKDFNPEDYYSGYSAVAALGEVIDLSNNIITWNKVLSEKMGVPNYIIKTKHTILDKEKRDQMRQDWQETIGGARNAATPFISDGDMDLQMLGVTPADINWIEGFSLTGRIIAMALGMPSELLNDANNKTYNNYKEAVKDWHLKTIIPLANQVYGAINRRMYEFYPDRPEIHIDMDQIDAISEDRELAATTATMLYSGRLLNKNEGREMMGYEEVKDGDKFDTTKKGKDGEVIEDTDTDKPDEQPVGIPEVAEAQDMALNGAQITALQGIVQAVADGVLPPDTAIRLIPVGFPAITEDQARRIIEPVLVFLKEKENTKEPAPPIKPVDETNETEPIVTQELNN